MSVIEASLALGRIGRDTIVRLPTIMAPTGREYRSARVTYRNGLSQFEAQPPTIWIAEARRKTKTSHES
jgi:hypothetical protein